MNSVRTTKAQKEHQQIVQNHEFEKLRESAKSIEEKALLEQKVRDN